MKHISKIFLLAIFSSLILVSCEDEVLVRTEDTTKADALLAEIDVAKNQLMTFVAETNALTISNAELEKTLEGLMAEHDALSGGYYSEPTEVHLTVNVISAANAAFSNPWGRQKSVEGLVGATVKVSQNGLDIAPSSSANGLYLFKGLVPGQVALRVEAANHTTVIANVIVWINNDDDAADAEAYNASTQIVLFPNAGALAGKLVGKVYANTSTLDDTLGREFGTSADYATAIRSTYITQPGPYYGQNYTQWNYNTYGNNNSLYGSPLPEAIKFADVTTGVKIYGRPYLDSNWGINNSNWGTNGYITSITYLGLMTSTTVNADGTFVLPLAAHSSYDDYELFTDMQITSDYTIWDHQRLTISDGSYNGEFNETGSTVMNFKYYNNTNAALPAVYTGTGVTTAAVNPNASLAVTRRVITEKWEYTAIMSYDYGNQLWNYTYLDNIPASEQTVTRNLYFFPTMKQE